MCQGDRAIEVHHRSSRSRCRSCIRSRNVRTGLRGGGSLPASRGGVSQPSRTASASCASARRGLRPGRRGTISATTRSPSVIRTVSPPAARRTYSLSLFLRIFRLNACNLLAYQILLSQFRWRSGQRERPTTQNRVGCLTAHRSSFLLPVKGRGLLRDCHVDELIQSHTLCHGQTRAERQMINQKSL
jgi:hypothetical protein